MRRRGMRKEPSFAESESDAAWGWSKSNPIQVAFQSSGRSSPMLQLAVSDQSDSASDQNKHSKINFNPLKNSVP